MNRVILIQGMIRMFVPLVVGTVTAVITGRWWGKPFGFTFITPSFFIIVPIIGGGIGEGAFYRCRWPIRRSRDRRRTFTSRA